MKFLFRTVCGLFLVLMVCSTAFSEEKDKTEKGKVHATQKSAAIIEVDKTTHDFGQVSQGDVVRHDFKVLNKGDVILEIKSVKPG